MGKKTKSGLKIKSKKIKKEKQKLTPELEIYYEQITHN